MTTYSTGNPLGSSDPRDLYDNAENLDNFVNGEQPSYDDRLGRSRRSWQSVEDQADQQEVEFQDDQTRREDEFQDDQTRREDEFQDDQTRREDEFQDDQDVRATQFATFIAASGYEFVGDYAAGIELTGYQQILRDTSGEFWRLSGSVTLPYTTTGAGLPEGGNFVAVGDAALRQDLVQPVATFNNVADMVASGGLDVGRKVRTLGYYTPGDGGGNDYEIVSAGTGTADGGSFIDLDNGLQARGLFNHGVYVNQFGADSTGNNRSEQEIQSAQNYIESIGGGHLLLKGQFKVRKDNPVPSSTEPSDCALHFYGSNITYCGVGDAKIFRDPESPEPFVMIRWSKFPIVNGEVAYRNSHITNLELDGGFSPDESKPLGSAAIILWHGFEDSSINEFWIHGSDQYGLGMQNGGHRNCRVYNGLIEDTGADGIDVKNNGDNDSGNVISSVVFRRFGRAITPSTSFAGLDMMSAWSASDVWFEDFGDIGDVGAAVRFKQGEEGDARGAGGHKSNLSNFHIFGKRRLGSSSATSDTEGLVSQCRNVKAVNGYIENVKDGGVRASQEGCSFVSITTDRCGYGFRTAQSSWISSGDKTKFIACSASNSDLADFRLETSNNKLTNCDAEGGNICLSMTSGAENNAWDGGNISNWITKPVGNNGGESNNNIIRNCTGYTTEKVIESDPFLIDSVSSPSVTFMHGLEYTPNVNDCQLQVKRSPNNTTSVITTRLVSTTSTIIQTQARVSQASSVAGDTATVVCRIKTEALPVL